MQTGPSTAAALRASRPSLYTLVARTAGGPRSSRASLSGIRHLRGGAPAASLPIRLVRRAFSTIQRGHDKQKETLYERLGFGKDAESHRIRRTLTELEQGFVQQVRLLKDPVGDAKDAARLEELKEAYVLLRDDNFRRNYSAHYYNSNDAALHVLVDGGAVAANFNPEHQSFEFIDHAMLRNDGGRTQAETLGGENNRGGGATAGSAHSTSFASTQEAYRNATGTGSGATAAAEAYNATTAKAPVNGGDISFLLKINFEESLLGCSRQLSVLKHTQCQGCGGAGAQSPKSGRGRNCPQCSGRGSVHLPSATYHIERKCNYCGGEGTMPPPRCGRCGGRGVLLEQPHTVAVSVPAGTFTGAVFRLGHKGHDGVRGGRAGDLLVTIMAAEHRHFYRTGADLHAMLPLSLSTALLGGVVDVPALSLHATAHKPSTRGKNNDTDGDGAGRPIVSLRIPPCARNGQILSLRQHQVKAATTGSSSGGSSSPDSGNIFYHVLVLIPKGEALSGRQKAALSAYEAAVGSSATRTTATEADASSASAPSSSSSGSAADAAAAAASEEEARDARLEHCAELKAQYSHWFAV